ncbi:protein disulfide-isomerase A2 [Aulostomus maculatus]
MRTLLTVTLLGLLLLLGGSCIQANDTQKTEEPVETEDKEEPKKEKTTEIEEENDVMVLHINNFARALSENPFLLVEFYAPWCGHCRKLEPVYSEAAGELKKEGPVMRLAKVDATEEKELAEEFGVGGFPTLKLFVNGDRKKPVDFTGKRSLKGIVQWMKRRAGPGASVLDSADSAAQFIEAHKIAVVGFFNSLESEAVKVFNEVVMDDTDTEFGVTATPEVLQKYGVKADAVVLFKKFDDGRADFILPEDGKLDKSNVTAFIKANSLELIITFNKETSEMIFTSRIVLHSLLFINSSMESHTALMEEFRTVAREFKGKMLFISIDVTADVSHVLTYFGVREDEVPTSRIINMETGKKFKIDTQDLTTDSLRHLSQEVVDGTAKPYYRTEEVPEDWNKGPVNVLVGKNFESVALDPTKNVFVEFYAPWCAHCKELAPIWEQLGEKYASHDDIIIAKMDATANEVESLSIDGFPTLKYFPAGGKEVVNYEGNRDLETLSKFLENGGVLPEGEDKQEDQDDEDDEDDDDNEEGGDEVSAKTQTNTTSRDEL